jgi:LPXTG-motif cell wall-anchored protein
VPLSLIVVVLLGAALLAGGLVWILRRRRAEGFPVLIAAFGLGLAVATTVTWMLLRP